MVVWELESRASPARSIFSTVQRERGSRPLRCKHYDLEHVLVRQVFPQWTLATVCFFSCSFLITTQKNALQIHSNDWNGNFYVYFTTHNFLLLLWFFYKPICGECLPRLPGCEFRPGSCLQLPADAGPGRRSTGSRLPPLTWEVWRTSQLLTVVGV